MNQGDIDKIRNLWSEQKIHRIPSILLCRYKGETYLTTRNHETVSFFIKRNMPSSGEPYFTSHAAVTRKCIITELHIGTINETIYEIKEEGALQIVSSSKSIDLEGQFAATIIDKVFPHTKS